VTADDRRRSGRRPWLPLLLLLALLGACSGGDSPRGPHPGLGVYIPASWSTIRQVHGHDVHVVKKHVRCSSCHVVGESEMGPVRPERCAACHEKETKIQHAGSQALAKLGTTATSDCTLCHRFRETLPLGALETTPAGAELGAHAHAAGDCAHCHLKAQGQTPPVQIHATRDCLSCHRPHADASPQSGPCRQCHEAISTTHAAQGKSPNQVCTTCHQKQHAPATEALGRCADCHSKQQPIIPATALFDGGHQECVGCHRPHDFEKSKAEPCRTCHQNVVVLAQAKVPAHQQCTSCHSPHDVRGSPEQACARCHATQQPDHPKHGLSGTCVGCHDPHPGFNHPLARAADCSSCHQAAAKETAFHAGVECKRCHAPHDFVREKSDHRACEACHATQVASAAHSAGHQACETCHRGLPHQPLLAMSGCETCHAAERARVNEGHTRCVGCHEPHSGSQAAACGSCHKPEQASAPPGHQTCRNCHEAHSGSPAAAPCAKCHAPQAQSRHGQLAGDCHDCHRPHGPSGVAAPPPCSSCHERRQLPGLHQVEKHAPCSRCHTGHGDATGARHDVCLSCHTDRKQHFPDAPSCASCHLFGKNR
jgi:hypothetical protein